MNTTCHILGILGSLRREPYNRGVLRAATDLVPVGATLDVFELDGIPGFNPASAPARPLRRCGSGGERSGT